VAQELWVLFVATGVELSESFPICFLLFLIYELIERVLDVGLSCVGEGARDHEEEDDSH